MRRPEGKSRRSHLPLLTLAALALPCLASCDFEGLAGGGAPEAPAPATVVLEDGTYVIDWDADPKVDRYDLTIIYDLYPEGPDRSRKIEGATPPVQVTFDPDSLYDTGGSPTEMFVSSALGISVLELTVVSGDGESEPALTTVPVFPNVRLQIRGVCTICETGRYAYAVEVSSGVAEVRDSIVVYWSASPGVGLDAPNRWVLESDEERLHQAEPGRTYYYRAIAYAEIGDSGLSPEVAVGVQSF